MRADTLRGLAAAAVLAMASAALAHDDDDDNGLRFVPSSLVCKKYNGADDDLLTASARPASGTRCRRR